MESSFTLGDITFDGGPTITLTQHGWGLQSISDWMSLTSSKTEINERPQAHGAFDPGTDWRKSSAHELKVAYYGTSYTDLEQAIRHLNSLAVPGTLVEGALTVDGQTTRRMCDVRNIDVPDTRGRSNLQGIVVDLLAPDPRAYGVVSSDSTGLPVHGSGLVFDTFPSTRWTGTPNASTSTLSQDGQVVATNLLTSPRTLDGYAVKWGNPNNVSLQTDDNGDTYLHIVGSSSNPVTYVIALPGVDRPAISTACIQARSNVDIDRVNVNYNTSQPLTGDGMWHYMQATDSTSPAWGPTGTVFGHEYFLQDGQNVVLKDGQYLDFKLPALFSPSDFQGMQTRGVTWFDGDSYPGHLLFPVSFGSPGSDGRARFANTGTAPASVTMTVVGGGSEGITLKRVENGAVLTLSRPCNPDDRIIFDSSDGSVLLNGQAELSGWMTIDDYDRFDVEAGDTCTVQLGVMGGIVGVPRLTVSAAPAYW